MPAPHAAHSASPVTSTLEHPCANSRFDIVFDSNTVLTDFWQRSVLPADESLIRIEACKIPPRNRSVDREIQFSASTDHAGIRFPTDRHCSQMIAYFYSTQARHLTASDSVQDVPTRRSTERCTARLFQGRPSLFRPQTCQHHAPPTVDRR